MKLKGDKIMKNLYTENTKWQNDEKRSYVQALIKLKSEKIVRNFHINSYRTRECQNHMKLLWGSYKTQKWQGDEKTYIHTLIKLKVIKWRGVCVQTLIKLGWQNDEKCMKFKSEKIIKKNWHTVSHETEMW